MKTNTFWSIASNIYKTTDKHLIKTDMQKIINKIFCFNDYVANNGFLIVDTDFKAAIKLISTYYKLII